MYFRMLREQLIDTVLTTWDTLNEKLSQVNPAVLVAISATGTYVLVRIARAKNRSDRPLAKR